MTNLTPPEADVDQNAMQHHSLCCCNYAFLQLMFTQHTPAPHNAAEVQAGSCEKYSVNRKFTLDKLKYT